MESCNSASDLEHMNAPMDSSEKHLEGKNFQNCKNEQSAPNGSSNLGDQSDSSGNYQDCSSDSDNTSNRYTNAGGGDNNDWFVARPDACGNGNNLNKSPSKFNLGASTARKSFLNAPKNLPVDLYGTGAVHKLNGKIYYDLPLRNGGSDTFVGTRNRLMRQQEGISGIPLNRSISCNLSKLTLAPIAEENEIDERRAERTPPPSHKSAKACAIKSSDKSKKTDTKDYKALWEAAKRENCRLKKLLKEKDQQIAELKAQVEYMQNSARIARENLENRVILNYAYQIIRKYF